MDYNIVEDYLKCGEKFNCTGDEKYPFLICEFSDEDLIREYNTILSQEKLHWREEWLFIFNHAIMNRRKRKIEKIIWKIKN